jgi:hypothetical protein
MDSIECSGCSNQFPKGEWTKSLCKACEGRYCEDCRSPDIHNRCRECGEEEDIVLDESNEFDGEDEEIELDYRNKLLRQSRFYDEPLPGTQTVKIIKRNPNVKRYRQQGQPEVGEDDYFTGILHQKRRKRLGLPTPKSKHRPIQVQNPTYASAGELSSSSSESPTHYKGAFNSEPRSHVDKFYDRMLKSQAKRYIKETKRGKWGGMEE